MGDEKRVEHIAIKAFRLFECRDYARVDIRIDREGKIYVLEVNPNPDISLNPG
jgi:D-alanine-D-alanine ligase